MMDNSGVVNLQAVSEANVQQARAEEIQRRILAAQLAAQTLDGATSLSHEYVLEVCEAFDEFLTVE